MNNLKLVLIMFVLAVTNVAFGVVEFNPVANDCPCGCGKKDEGSIDKDMKSKAIGDDDLVMICMPR